MYKYIEKIDYDEFRNGWNGPCSCRTCVRVGKKGHVIVNDIPMMTFLNNCSI